MPDSISRPNPVKILFVLKHRDAGPYGAWNHVPECGKQLSSGLYNSAKFVVDMLNRIGVVAKLVEVVDNNGIDREIHKFKPNIVIIEAYWVVPEKFDVLMPLHPTVKWIVRDHSKSEFLANEGIAFGWSLDYLKRGIEIACNSKRAQRDMQGLATAAGLEPDLVTYLPNYYELGTDCEGIPGIDALQVLERKLVRILGLHNAPPNHKHEVNIACFGAIRPLKNHINQAIAAIEFAGDHRIKLKFHINGNRVEQKADPILKNLHEIFARVPQHQLVEHAWVDHKAFLKTMRKMQISMQVTFSETFNIVSADAVNVGVPAVVSPEVPWLDEESQADPNNVRDIRVKLEDVWHDLGCGCYVADQRWQLREYSKESQKIWRDRFVHND